MAGVDGRGVEPRRRERETSVLVSGEREAKNREKKCSRGLERGTRPEKDEVQILRKIFLVFSACFSFFFSSSPLSVLPVFFSLSLSVLPCSCYPPPLFLFYVNLTLQVLPALHFELSSLCVNHSLLLLSWLSTAAVFIVAGGDRLKI